MANVEILKQLLVVGYLGAVLSSGLISCATPWRPQADSLLPWLSRIVQFSSPVILLAAAFGWVQPRLPLAVGSGAYVAAVLIGFVVAIVTVQKNPDLTEKVTIQQLLARFSWYGPLYVALAILQVVGAGVALHLLMRGKP